MGGQICGAHNVPMHVGKYVLTASVSFHLLLPMSPGEDRQPTILRFPLPFMMDVLRERWTRPRGLSLPLFWVKRHPTSHPSIHSQAERVYWSVKAQQSVSCQHLTIKEDDEKKYLRQHFWDALKMISQLEQCWIFLKKTFSSFMWFCWIIFMCVWYRW